MRGIIHIIQGGREKIREGRSKKMGRKEREKRKRGGRRERVERERSEKHKDYVDRV